MDVSHHRGEVDQISEKLEKSLSMDSEDKMETYHRLIQDGKDVARQGDMHRALELFRRALGLQRSQKLESRIQKLQEVIAQNDLEDDEEEFVDVCGSGLLLFKELHDKLFAYQRRGVAFLYGLYRDGRRGGILADDMGLGKTVQVISFLSGMYDGEHVRTALLVMPTSLITNWTREFARWTPGIRVKEFHGASKGERARNLERVQRRGGVLITTYNMLINNWQQLAAREGREFTWDYVILDEAHKIKTATTKTAKSAHAIPSRNRLLLTGTPVQNNLRELWALFDFACQGTLLGTAKTFKAEYENPITRAREKDATPGERALGCRMSENLMAIIRPHFLRRTKAEVQRSEAGRGGGASGDTDLPAPDPQRDPGAEVPKLTRKNDLIVWTYLSAVQEDIYRQFLSLDHIKELLLTTRSPLAELTILKKLCDHPRLLSAAAIAKLGLEEAPEEEAPEEGPAGSQRGDADADAPDAAADAHGIAHVPDDTLIAESGKLVFLFALLERLRAEGHRTLVFAHYRKVLDILERILGHRGFRVMRLDGTVTHVAERQRRITRFQTDERYSVFLLTTQVGGVGITLTAADRVVIYDPSWNPATDAQAVDRAYRIGQTENVVIYRLITCGTVEEKIYRRQVFKDSLIRQNTGDKKNPFRYFSKQELKELFTLEDPRTSSTQLQLQALHATSRRSDPELDAHIAHLHAMEMFGISDHDLMFSVDVHHDENPEDQQEQHYIEGRVQKAQELVKAESELQQQLAESLASGTEPAWLRTLPAGPQPRNPRASPSHPQHGADPSSSPVLVESDRSGSYREDEPQNQSRRVVDLTADEDDGHRDSEPDESLVMLEADASDGHVTDAADGHVTDASVQELMDQSAASAGERSPAYVTAVDDVTSHSECDDSEMEVGLPPVTPLQNKRLSVLQASNLSLKGDASSRVSAGLESFEGNFNLQLEDSDMFSDGGAPDAPDAPEAPEAPQTEEEEEQEAEEEEEEEERKLLSRLQLDGSFDVDKSLSESMNDSVVAAKRRRAAVIYSEDEDDEDEEQEQLENSFQVLGASTPKSASSSTPLRSRRSVGGNTSVASRRSLLHSIIEDMETHDHDEEEEEEEEEPDDDGSGRRSEAEEEDVIDPSCNELQLEETTGETLNTEEEEEEEEEEEQEEEEEEEEEEEGEGEEQEQHSESPEFIADSLEESTNQTELGSSERMDQCAADAGVRINGTDGSDGSSGSSGAVEPETYESLVRRGRRCHSGGRLADALGFFLRAIDIRPGDSELQLVIIQLYRQQSQSS